MNTRAPGVLLIQLKYIVIKAWGLHECPHSPQIVMCIRHSSILGTDSRASLFNHKPVHAFICLSILLVITLLPHTLQLYLISLNVNLSPFNLLTLLLSRVFRLLLYLLSSALLDTCVFILCAPLFSWPPLFSMPCFPCLFKRCHLSCCPQYAQEGQNCLFFSSSPLVSFPLFSCLTSAFQIQTKQPQ